jgi:hypothetical protein
VKSSEKNWLRLPVMSLAAEHLVMGHLMRRNVLAYKAPPGNEGYDLICIHPDPRHKPSEHQLSRVHVQVKSRYATDCGRGFPVKNVSIDAFHFLVAVFLNIGNFYRGRDGSTGAREPDYYTFPREFIREHHIETGGWEKVMISGLKEEIEKYKGEAGFELIAKKLGVPRPTKRRGS